MNLPDEKREAVRRLLDEHQPLPITETGLVHIGYGCPAPCCWGNEGGYDLDAHRRHVADALAPVVARWLAEARGEALREALSGVTTHNGTPVTVKNLRWAATHEALCRSYIFDVLMGLADALEGQNSPETPPGAPNSPRRVSATTETPPSRQRSDK